MEDNLTEDSLAMVGNLMADSLMVAKDHITTPTLSKAIIMEDTITMANKVTSTGSPVILRAILVEIAWPVWELCVVPAVALTVSPDILVQSYNLSLVHIDSSI